MMYQRDYCSVDVLGPRIRQEVSLREQLRDSPTANRTTVVRPKIAVISRKRYIKS